MHQNNEQLNNNAHEDESLAVRKRSKVWDIILWVLIAALAIAVLVRAFVVSNVTVSGVSMTADYYNAEDSQHFNPALTYHSGDKVTVNKLKKPHHGDVVVFYKNPVKSKFLGNFARGDSVEQGGEYYKLIKRVVALGGDRLWVEKVGDGKYRVVIQTADAPDGTYLYEDYYTIDNKPLDSECFILEEGHLGCLASLTADNPLVIEQGYFFAMGDNRANSADSRGELGPVPLTQLFGVVI